MFKHLINLIAISALALLSTPSLAVKTFNCDKATATVARIICNDNRLSKLDDDLDKVYDDYAEILQNFNDEDKKKLFETFKQNHLDWQKSILVPCQSAQCAESVYTQRIGEFNKMNNTFRKQIQEAKTGSGAGATKEQPSVASNPVKPATVKVSSHVVEKVVRVMGIANPTIESVGVVVSNILTSGRDIFRLTNDYCGIYNSHPRQNIIEARLQDLYSSGKESLGPGLGSCHRVVCKDRKVCISRSRTDACYDYGGDEEKFDAGVAYLSEACAALSR